MKNIYQQFFNACSKEEKELITNLEKDLINDMNHSDLSKKYHFTQSEEIQHHYLCREIDKEKFCITLNNHSISFSVEKEFETKYIFSISLEYSVKNNTYEIDFSINDTVDPARYMNNVLSLHSNVWESLDFFNNLPSSLIKRYDLYFFEDDEIMNTIIQNINNPDNMKDTLLLKHDLNLDENELLKEIKNYSNASLKQKEIKSKSKIGNKL